jgi:hypothetical protein
MIFNFYFRLVVKQVVKQDYYMTHLMSYVQHCFMKQKWKIHRYVAAPLFAHFWVFVSQVLTVFINKLLIRVRCS